MSDYVSMRRQATVLRDNGNYDLARGEMNPVIVEDFIGLILDAQLPSIVWEPFAGTGSPRFWNEAQSVGVMWIGHTLRMNDARFRKADSTKVGPGVEIGAVLFHPTYFGSSPLCADARDLACALDENAYKNKACDTAKLAQQAMVRHGLACVVARDYRAQGRRVRLDRWFLSIFEGLGFVLKDVWSSEPDIVLILRSE